MCIFLLTNCECKNRSKALVFHSAGRILVPPWRCCFSAIPSPPLRFFTSKAIIPRECSMLAKPSPTPRLTPSAIHRAPSIQYPTQQSRREEDVEQEAEPETIRGPARREQIANRQKPQNKCDNRAEKYAQVFKQIFKSWFAQNYHSGDSLSFSWFYHG